MEISVTLFTASDAEASVDLVYSAYSDRRSLDDRPLTATQG